MYLSGGFLALMLFGYIIALFSLSFSLGVHCKDKSGYGSSYVIGHGAHLFRHETGSHILSILFVYLSFESVPFEVVHLCFWYLNPCLRFGLPFRVTTTS